MIVATAVGQSLRTRSAVTDDGQSPRPKEGLEGFTEGVLSEQLISRRICIRELLGKGKLELLIKEYNSVTYSTIL